MTLLTLSQKSFEIVVSTRMHVSFTDGTMIRGESSEIYENMLEPCTKYYTKDNAVIAVYYHNLKGGIIK